MLAAKPLIILGALCISAYAILRLPGSYTRQLPVSMLNGCYRSERAPATLSDGNISVDDGGMGRIVSFFEENNNYNISLAWQSNDPGYLNHAIVRWNKKPNTEIILPTSSGVANTLSKTDCP